MSCVLKSRCYQRLAFYSGLLDVINVYVTTVTTRVEKLATYMLIYMLTLQLFTSTYSSTVSTRPKKTEMPDSSCRQWGWSRDTYSSTLSTRPKKSEMPDSSCRQWGWSRDVPKVSTRNSPPPAPSRVMCTASLTTVEGQRLK